MAANRLPAGLREELLERLAKESVEGILLGGSYARGEQTDRSDVDLFVLYDGTEADLGELRCFRARSSNCLVTTSRTSAEREIGRMARPSAALWTVPGIRQSQVLYDRTGAAARVQQAAQRFRWEDLGNAPSTEASSTLAGLAEEVAKVVAGLDRGDPYRIGNALPGLINGLTQSVAMARGVLVDTENRWLLIVEEEVGADAPWSRAHRKALGIEGPGRSTIWERAEGGLEGYLETADLLKDILRTGDREVVELARMQIAGRPARPR